jgi:hypothetical protein
MKHARSYWLLLAAAHWCPGKASLALIWEIGSRQDEKSSEASGCKPINATQIAKSENPG